MSRRELLDRDRGQLTVPINNLRIRLIPRFGDHKEYATFHLKSPFQYQLDRALAFPGQPNTPSGQDIVGSMYI
jgi:hypothetical protein